MAAAAAAAASPSTHSALNKAQAATITMPFQKNSPSPVIDSMQALRDLEEKIKSQAAEINLLREQLTANSTSAEASGDNETSASTVQAKQEKVDGSEATSFSVGIRAETDEVSLNTEGQNPGTPIDASRHSCGDVEKGEEAAQKTETVNNPEQVVHPVQEAGGNSEGCIIQGVIAEYKQHISSTSTASLAKASDATPAKKRVGSDVENVHGATPDEGTSPKKPKICSKTFSDPETDKVPKGTVGFEKYGEKDVISGRGGGTNNHPGNMQFRELINRHRRQYLSSKKLDKPAISRSVVQKIREAGGRFLKYSEKKGLWFEMGDDAAREKTSQALRQRAREMRHILFGEFGPMHPMQPMHAGQLDGSNDPGPVYKYNNTGARDEVAFMQAIAGRMDGTNDPGPVYKYNNTGARDDVAFLHAMAEARMSAGRGSSMPALASGMHHQGQSLVPPSNLDPSRSYLKRDPPSLHMQSSSQAQLIAQHHQHMLFEQNFAKDAARQQVAPTMHTSTMTNDAHMMGQGIPPQQQLLLPREMPSSSGVYPPPILSSLDATEPLLSRAEGSSALAESAGSRAPQGMYPPRGHPFNGGY